MAKDFRQILAAFSGKLKKFFQFAKFIFWPKNRALKFGLVFIVLFSIIIVGRSAYALEVPGLDWLFGILSYVLYAIAYALGWIAMKIFALIVLISSYNDFVTSPAVNKGWVLTRDVSNLFFVLVLLVIAFCQILHVERYKLQQILPTLLIAAVLVNFSKLICGLMIDFAQVVMMTFVNGYAATAGANLFHGLGLKKIFEMDEGQVPRASHLDVFVAMALGVFVLTMVVIVTFFILVLFAIRIVTLWILIVLSPFAFVLEAVPVGGLQAKAKEWWQKFGWSVAVGPAMAFFLWLSLAIMANPEEMISIDSAEIEGKSATGVVSKMSLVDNLAQSAIGLAMLMASLMVAQEAGGMIGSMAGKGMGFAKKAALGIAKRATGYSAVTGMGSAYMKGGWAGVAGTGKIGSAIALAGVTVQGLAKRAAALPFTYAGSLITGAAKKVGGKVGKTKAFQVAKEKYKEVKEMGKTTLAELKASRFGKGIEDAWRTTDWVGNAEEITAYLIRKEKYEKRRRDNEQLLAVKMAGKGTSEEERLLIEAISNAGAPKGLRVAAAMKLAEEGKLDTADKVKDARELIKGDRDGEKILNDNVQKFNAHLAMDLKIEDNRTKLAGMMREGKVDISQQSTTALQNTELLQVAMQTLGPKVFADKLGDASKKSVAHKDAVKAGVGALAAAEHRRIGALPTGTNEEKEAQKKARENIQNVVANVTSNLNLAFGKRDGATGEVIKEKQTVDGKEVERTPIDAEQEEALRQYVGKMSPKQLAGTDLQDDALTHIAQNITSGQVEKLAKSHEENARPNLEKIIQKVLDQCQKTDQKPEARRNSDRLLAEVASKGAIMGAIKSELADRVKEIKTLVAEARARENTESWSGYAT